MKNIIVTMFIFSAILIVSPAYAQMMSGFFNSVADWDEVVEHTLREEKEGKELWEKLEAKEISCTALPDEQFGVLGEYFMGQMMGDSHAAMNAMMMQMHGEEGEEQIHIAMGKRLSGCARDAVIPMQGQGWMPMMQMMWGGWSSPRDNGDFFNNHMMYGFNNGIGGFGFFGGIVMILWWVLIIVGIVALIKWVSNSNRSSNSRSALDVLKERYARGEIDKKEFEEKRGDLQ